MELRGGDKERHGKREARDGGSRETQEKKEREPDRQPEGHLKVNGMLLTSLVTRAEALPPSASSRSLARTLSTMRGWLVDVKLRNVFKRHRD